MLPGIPVLQALPGQVVLTLGGSTAVTGRCPGGSTGSHSPDCRLPCHNEIRDYPNGLSPYIPHSTFAMAVLFWGKGMSRLAKFCLVLSLLYAGCSEFTAADAQVRLVFQVGSAGASIDEQSLRALKDVIEKRLQASELKSNFVVETKLPNELTVLAPALSEEQIKLIRGIVIRPGTLEFAVIANRNDHQALIAKAEEPTVGAADSEISTAWFPLKPDSNGVPREFVDDGTSVFRETEHEGNVTREVLCVFVQPRLRVTDEHIVDASKATVSNVDPPAMQIKMNQRGGYLLSDLTSKNQSHPGSIKRLAIILDGAIHGSPRIMAVVGSNLVITGDFTPRELDEMVAALNGGRLPMAVQFVEVESLATKERAR